MSPEAATPSARTFAALALGVIAFTLYGSLVPFQLRHADPETEKPTAEFVAVLGNITRVGSKSDFIANYLLGVPLGFCVLAWLRLDRSPNPARNVLAMLAAWPACILFAAFVEFLQLFFKDRTCTGSDIFAQSAGSLTGMLFWIAAGERIVRRFRRVWQGRSGGTARRLLMAYLVLLALALWLPLNLTLSPAELYRKNFAGPSRISFVPFEGAGSKVATLMVLAGLYFPAGLLAAGINRYPWDRLGGAVYAIFIGTLIAFAFEAGQLFVESRSTSITDIIVGAFSFFAGWLLMRLVYRPHPQGLSLNQELIGLQAIMFYLLFLSWYPFDFNKAVIDKQYQAIEWIPFKTAYERNYLSSLEEAVSKTLLFTPIGAVIAATGVRRVKRRWLAIAAGVGIAAVIEAGQLALPGRVSGPTDLIFAGAGAWLGAAATLRLRAFGYGIPAGGSPKDFVRFKVK